MTRRDSNHFMFLQLLRDFDESNEIDKEIIFEKWPSLSKKIRTIAKKSKQKGLRPLVSKYEEQFKNTGIFLKSSTN